jgi:hypothetical protein
MIAASLLKRQGFKDLTDVAGGYSAIQKTGVHTVDQACSSTKA